METHTSGHTQLTAGGAKQKGKEKELDSLYNVLEQSNSDEEDGLNEEDGLDEEIYDPPLLGGECPETSASWFSKLIFDWITPMIKVGYKRPLGFDDIYTIPPVDYPEEYAKKFEECWDYYKLRSESHFELAKSVFSPIKGIYTLVGIIRIMNMVSNLIIPYLISQLILFVQEDGPYWKGLFYVFLLLLAATVSLLANHWFSFFADRLSNRIRAMLTLIVYKKSLKISKVSKGNANNAMSVDPSRIGGMTWHLHSTYNLPILVLFAFFMLYMWLGISSFVAIGILSIMVPFNYFSLKAFHKCQEEIMKLADIRIKKLTEILQGILIVKLFSWEDSVKNKISEVRQEEIRQLKIFAYSLALLMFFILSLTTIVSVFTFTVYSLLEHELQAHQIFPSLALFNQLASQVLTIPWMMSRMSEANVSFERLNKFLRKPELVKIPRKKLPEDEEDIQGQVRIEIKNGNFEWIELAKDEEDYESEYEQQLKQKNIDNNNKTQHKSKIKNLIEWIKPKKEKDDYQILLQNVDELENEESTSENNTIKEKFSLKEINLKIKNQELLAVIGRVGAGKSSLLSSILGEVNKTSGSIDIFGSIAYVSQRAWIRNASLRDNILFGNPYHTEKYKKVLEVCCLVEDISSLQAGDATEIGEKGINLSGGQKQRISLARAVYADSDIYLLDDPLSAVDAHVGKKIFQNCIKGFLKHKTIVLVSHQLQYLTEVDEILVMEQGQIQQLGTFQELASKGIDFAGLLEKVNSSDQEIEISEDKLKLKLSENTALKLSQELKKNENFHSKKSKQGRLIDEEERNTGSVKFSVYMGYLKSCGSNLFLLSLLILSITLEGASNLSSYWLARWSNETSNPNADPQLKYYLGIYLLIGFVSIIASFGRQFLWAKGTLDCSTKLHKNLLQGILRAPMSFFYKTPTGRIINRFSNDIEAVDLNIPDLMSDLWLCLFGSGTILIVITLVMPWFFLGILPILIVYYYVMQYFRNSSRELGRLSSMSFSPIMGQYLESLDGAENIRALEYEDLVQKENLKFVRNSLGTYLCVTTTNRWLGVRVEFLGALVITFVAFLIVVAKGSISMGLAGLILSLGASVIAQLSWMIRCGAQLESNMNRVERILTYSNIEPEGLEIIEENRPPSNWPQKGTITFENVSMRYSKKNGLALRNVNLTLLGKEKIGVVGRTGAGKSSLTNVLFRLVKLEEGKIFIDDIDIGTIGLKDLRKNLTIIPQDPVLFSGTMRSNLDPFNEYSDSDIWRTLERVHIKEYIRGLPLGLESVVEPNGTSLSVGQRQLLCMGRALLKDTKIILLDEATASVDTETDAVIQKTIRSEFNDRTVITIAHRLNTIMDSDKVLVMDAGSVVEYDKPSRLLQRSDGVFYKLVEDTGKSSATALHKLAGSVYF